MSDAAQRESSSASGPGLTEAARDGQRVVGVAANMPLAKQARRNASVLHQLADESLATVEAPGFAPVRVECAGAEPDGVAARIER